MPLFTSRQTAGRHYHTKVHSPSPRSLLSLGPSSVLHDRALVQPARCRSVGVAATARMVPPHTPTALTQPRQESMLTIATEIISTQYHHRQSTQYLSENSISSGPAGSCEESLGKMAVCRAWASASAALAAMLYWYVRSSVGSRREDIYRAFEGGAACVAWRHTLACSPFGWEPAPLRAA